MSNATRCIVSKKKKLEKIKKILYSNNVVSLISDAGTPLISDPGKILVEDCIKNGINIFPIPGASAVTASISISGFSDQFYFNGFLPEKKQQVTNELKRLSEFGSSLVFFVSPKKINKIIPEIKKHFSERKIVICREITKLYEEFLRANVDELEEFQKEPKGELTVVISEKKTDENNSLNLSCLLYTSDAADE